MDPEWVHGHWDPGRYAQLQQEFCQQDPFCGLCCAVLCWENMVLHVDKEALPVDEAVSSLQATLVDKTDAFLEMLLANRKKRTSRIRTTGVEPDF